MTTSIYLRTYHKDIAWLHKALESIYKYCTGFKDIIICIPQSQRHLLNHLTAEKIVTCPDYANDYLGQQISKLLAYQHTDADYVFYTDSDCIFLKPTKPEDFFIDGKPYLLKTPYSKVGDAICWKEPTETALNAKVEYEYMRRLPLIYHTSTLRDIDKFMGGIERYILSRSSFSEFNLIGAYAEIHEPESYVFLDTDTNALPAICLKQFFSHDGVDNFTNEIHDYIHGII